MYSKWIFAKLMLTFESIYELRRRERLSTSFDAVRSPLNFCPLSFPVYFPSLEKKIVLKRRRDLPFFKGLNKSEDVEKKVL